jgi:hypothetical protein
MAAAPAPRSFVALPFQPVDVPGQIARRRLIERGEADGRSNLPPSDSAAPSATEQEVIADIRAERDRLAGQLGAHLRAQNDGLATLDAAMDVARIRNDAEHAISRLEQSHVAWKGEIQRLLREARDAKKEYDDFRIEHGLQRPARNRGNGFLTLALLGLAIAIESALNGVFFAEGSEFGLVGGVTLALGISVVNVLVFGFVLGLFPARWTHHRSFLVRAIGWLLLLCGVVLLLLANGLVAHFRDAYERLGDSVELGRVWAHLAAEPFGLVRIQSWLLFFLGLFFAGLGFWKGYGFDDPYPGYGRVARRRLEAEHAYLDSREERLEQASAIRDETKSQLDRTIEQLRGAALQREQTLGARARIVQEYQAHERHLEEAANALLAAYRDANRRVRTTPPPRRFDDTFTFEDPALDQPTIQALLAVRPLRADPEALVGELDRLRSRVLETYRKIFDDAPEAV